MNDRPQPTPDQSMSIVLRDHDGEILLSCGRRSMTKNPEDDSVFLIAHLKDADDLKISLHLREAEEFFDLVLPLVSDKKERPFSGALSVNTFVGDSGERLTFEVRDAEDCFAQVKLTKASTDHPGASFSAERYVLDRFLHCCREGICDDIDAD